jgi:hypothetical protein
MLSILTATVILVGASYGAIFLAPYLAGIPTNWFLITTSAMILVSILLVYRRKRDARGGAA